MLETLTIAHSGSNKQESPHDRQNQQITVRIGWRRRTKLDGLQNSEEIDDTDWSYHSYKRLESC